MALGDDGTIFDDREPVLIGQINNNNLPTTLNKLRRKGVDLIQAGNIAGQATTPDAVDFLFQRGLITAEEKDRRKELIRNNVLEVEGQDPQPLSDPEDNNVILHLKHDQPNVSVQSSTRFSEHETIGGPIIRQRLGEGLVEISVEGACTTAEATVIDALRFENTVQVTSDRYSGTVQVAAVSTNPLEDGGAIDLDGDFTHSFGIEFVEVE